MLDTVGIPIIFRLLSNIFTVSMISFKWIKELGVLSIFFGTFSVIMSALFTPVLSYAGNSPTTPADLTRLTLEQLMAIQVTSVSRVKSLNKVSPYHVIFMNPSENGRMRSILRALKGTGILTIGDTPGFAVQCGVINFYLKSGKVRFEINIEASRRENLQISSKLLRLARIVNSQCN